MPRRAKHHRKEEAAHLLARAQGFVQNKARAERRSGDVLFTARDLVTPARLWLAVLLTFVLARVFAEGARMRDDLQGTV